MIRALIYLGLYLIPSIACAQWFTGQASQAINGMDYNEVRSATIEQAIENASLQASSFIKIEHTVTNGILSKSTSNLLSEHQISKITILNETVKNGILTINLKVNLQSGQSCTKDIYQKQLVIAQFPLLTPAQASSGDIYTLPFHVVSRFKNELTNQPSTFVEELIPQMVYKPDYHLDTLNLESVKGISHALSSQFQSQYLVFGYIRDIGLFDENKSNILTNTITPKRNFTIKVYMYDRVSNSILLENEYHGEGGWSFDSFSKVDLANSLFWRSEYGKTINDTLFKAAKDINEILSCEPTKANVINVDNEFVTINIGTLHGVKKGDVFNVVKLKNIPLRNSVLSTLMPPDKPIHLKVIQVSNKISLLVAPQDSDPNGMKQHQTNLYDVVTTTTE
ncbi:flagellar assembly protein T N-terminal domain-containing protein [Shewanella donghaensis]|uniref:flagellar assembly protein T N-terminal domain-containing protein n=1 Tax=Shewanella donghaensis TaxID=238836 RepID=UPI00118411AD|nr:flagellar assembly protein T N-terminal domain-containing protein [Shewanella donghaensis]